MKLPHREHAIVPIEKITEYVLDLAHEKGGPKARFFMRFGFTPDRPDVLAAALLEHGQTYDVEQIRDAFRERTYRIVGSLICPDERTPNVLTAWYIANDATIPIPRLVSAYPAQRGKDNAPVI